MDRRTLLSLEVEFKSAVFYATGKRETGEKGLGGEDQRV